MLFETKYYRSNNLLTVVQSLLKMLRAGILLQILIINLFQEDATAQEGSKAKDMKYKLLSGDLMPMVGCK